MPLTGAANKTFILSDEDYNKIVEELKAIFYENCKEEVEGIPKSVNYTSLKNVLTSSSKAAEAAIKAVENKDLSAWKSIESDLLEVVKLYPLVSLFSEQLRGKEVQYKIYVDKTSGVESFVLPLFDFLKGFKLTFEDIAEPRILMKFNFNSKVAEMRKYLEQEDVMKKFAEHRDKVINSMKEVKSKKESSLYVVKPDIYDKFRRQNPGLEHKENGKQTGSYQVFNLGNIDEAVDVAISNYNAQKEKRFSVETLVFSKYLNHDSIAFIKGGDNPYTNQQIKAKNATLTNLASAKNMADTILAFIKKVENPENLEKELKLEVEDFVKKNFYTNDRKISKSISKEINNTIDKLLKDVNKMNKT